MLATSATRRFQVRVLAGKKIRPTFFFSFFPFSSFLNWYYYYSNRSIPLTYYTSFGCSALLQCPLLSLYTSLLFPSLLSLLFLSLVLWCGFKQNGYYIYTHNNCLCSLQRQKQRKIGPNTTVSTETIGSTRYKYSGLCLTLCYQTIAPQIFPQCIFTGGIEPLLKVISN